MYLKAVIWTLEVQKEEPNVSFKRKTEQLSGILYLKRKIVKLRYNCFHYYIPQSDTYKIYPFIWDIRAKIR